MRPADQVYAQIRWDERLDGTRFTVGIDEHAAAEKIIAFDAFRPGGDIPWHRVRFFAFDGVRCWCRVTGADTVDQLASKGEAAPWRLQGPWEDRRPVRFDGSAWVPSGQQPGEPVGEELRIVSWNVLWDRYHAEQLDSAARWPALLEAILATDPHLVALQEVEPALARVVHDHPEVRRRWWVSHGPGHADLERFDLLLLGRVPVEQVALCTFGDHKGALGAVIQGWDEHQLVVTTHLSSDHRSGAAGHRDQELAALRGALGGLRTPWIVVGDFNMDEEVLLDGVDAWSALHPVALPTFDPASNPLAALNSRTGRAGRLDRVFVGAGLYPVRVERLGTSAVHGRWLSDHAGLSVEVRRGEQAGVHHGPPDLRSALAWVAPLPPGLARLRDAHDPAASRWPAHVNVVWGFVPECTVDEALELLDEVVSTVPPFEVHFERVARWGVGVGAVVQLPPVEAGPWKQLARAVGERFVQVDRALEPHLTVARGPTPAGLEGWLPWTSSVHELVWMTRRGGGRFEARVRATLGGGVVVCPEPALWVRAAGDEANTLCERVPEAVLVGSRAAGVALLGADIDLVWEVPDVETAERALEAAGATMRRVNKRGVPGLTGAWEGLGVDVVLVLPDTAPEVRAVALSALTDTAWVSEVLSPVQREVLLFVKTWARAQGLEDPAFGGLEGLAWARMVAEVPMGERDAGIGLFFGHWGAEELTEDRLLTPTAPVRPIATRVNREALEGALFEAWEALEDGGAVEDLLRVPAFHRHWAFAVLVRWEDEAGRGAVRNRGPALREWGPVHQVEGGVAFGCAVEDEALREQIEDLLRGSGAVVSLVPSAEVDLLRWIASS